MIGSQFSSLRMACQGDVSYGVLFWYKVLFSSFRPKDEEKIESELETTPEFRNFVAKKLSAIMDG